MNLKKTSIIALIALLSYDSFGASSIVRAGVTPLAQGSVKATSSTGSKSRASLGIGGYSDIGKLRPNRTQTGTGGSTGGSTGGTTDKNTCGDHDKIQEELTQLKENQEELEELIKDLTQVVADKDQEIKELRKDLASATKDINDFTGASYVTKTDLATRADEIAENAVAHALGAIDTKLSGYTTLKDVTTEIAKARSSIASDRVEVLKNYATIEDLEQTADNVVKDIEERNFVQQGKLDNAILLANQTAIEAAFQQTLTSVEQKYATKEALTTAVNGAVNTVNAAREQDLKSYTKTSQMVEFVQNITNQAVNTAVAKAVSDVENKGYVISTDLTDAVKNATNKAVASALSSVYLAGYATQESVTTAIQEAVKTVNAARAEELKSYTNTSLMVKFVDEVASQAVSTAVSQVARQGYVLPNKLQETFDKAVEDAALSAVKQVKELGYVTADVMNAADNVVLGKIEKDYATNKRVNQINQTTLTSISDLNTQISGVRTSVDNLDVTVKNGIDTAAVKDIVAKTLTDGEYASKTYVNQWGTLFVDQFNALPNTYAKKEKVDNLTTDLQDLTANFKYLNDGMGKYAPTSDITALRESITSLGGQLTTIKGVLDKYPSASALNSLEGVQATLSAKLDDIEQAQLGFVKTKTVQDLDLKVSRLNTTLSDLQNKVTNSYVTTDRLNSLVNEMTGIKQNINDLSSFSESFEKLQNRVYGLENLYLTLNSNMANYTKLQDYNTLKEVVSVLNAELVEINDNLDVTYATKEQLNNTTKFITTVLDQSYITQSAWKTQMQTFESKYTPTDKLNATISGLGFARSSELNDLQSALAALKVDLNRIDGNSVTQTNLDNKVTDLTKWVDDYYIAKENWEEQMSNYTPTANLGTVIERLNLFAPMQTTSVELNKLSSQLAQLLKPVNPEDAYVTQNSLYKTLTDIKYMNTETSLLTYKDGSFVLNNDNLARTIEKLTYTDGNAKFVTTKILGDYTKTSALKEYIEGLNEQYSLFVTPTQFTRKFNGLGDLYAPINDLTYLQSTVNGMSDSLLTQLRNDTEFKTSLVNEIKESLGNLPGRVDELAKSMEDVKGIADRLADAEKTAEDAADTAEDAADDAEEALRFATTASAYTTQISELEAKVANLTTDVGNAQATASSAAALAGAASETATAAKTAADSAVKSGTVAQQLAQELKKESENATTCSTNSDRYTINSALSGCK